ncbi:MAG: DUF1501 domain-containing protein [Gemmataceae bacterium]|nr:DUF1501 domain-containing protein [Gemmataceae bacterium]
MFSIPQRAGRLCDGSMTRRELLQVGGCGLLGLSLPSFFAQQAKANEAPKTGGKGWGKTKGVIFVFLQGGPPHLDLWDPKPEAPEGIRGPFKKIQSNVQGIELSETQPKLARCADKYTLIRSVSYSPKGLFNHTAAHYQMLTGYTPDRVSPSGQLEPPSPKDYPNIGSNIARLRPPDVPMLPFVMLPRPMQESNVVNKAGTAGFLGRAFDPYYLFQDPNAGIRTDDLVLRPDLSRDRFKNRAALRDMVKESMESIDRQVSSYALDEYYQKAFNLILSGRAKKAFDLNQEAPTIRDKYGRHTFGQSLLMARRLIESGTRFVQINWPAVANGDPNSDAWDCHAGILKPVRDLHGPKLDSALSSLIEDLSDCGMLQDTLVVAIGEFGRSPRMGVSTSGNGNAPDGRDHWPYCYTAIVAGGGIPGGKIYGKSDAHGSAPTEKPVHPIELLATIYHGLGIDPATEVMNDLNQPRPLVDAKPVLGLF